MTTWLYYKSGDDRTWKRRNLDLEPCLTVARAVGSIGATGGAYITVDEEVTLPTIEDKPPYRVPSMSEIAAIPPNGLTVASFFAGAGGSSTGYRMAGFKVLYANEFVPAAQESYKANAAPYTVVDGRDIKKVTPAEVLKACRLKVGELDVLDGSPPCQAFSTAGKGAAGWGTERHYEHGDSQKNEEMFTDYIRIRDGVMPRVFVAENVSGLVKGKAKGFFLEILRELRRGYRVTCPLLDAQWLGVPQARQRIVFIGVRDDLGVEPPVIAPLPYRYSVRDALPWIGRAVHDRRGGFPGVGDITDRLSATILGVDGKNVGDFQVQDRVVHQTHGQHKSQGDVTDKPSPVIVSRPASFAVERVVHDSGRGRAMDITDRPAPTITAGPDAARDGGGPRNHFKVEVVGNKNAPHSRKGERRSVDEPVRTLTARRSNVELQHTVESRKIQNGDTVPENVAASLEGYAIGAEWDKLNPGQQSDKFFSLVRPDADQPCPTITASAVGSAKAGGPGNTASVTHPFEKRKFSILEVKRLCAFPDDFILKGTYGAQWERCGNSVPPVMMMHVAVALRDNVFGPWKAAQARAKKPDAQKKNNRKVLDPRRPKRA